MQEVTSYQCDYCKNKFDTLAECIKCEQIHVAVDALKTITIYQYKTPYPTALHVSFIDDKTITYVRMEE